jgi:hypothetical protein
MAANPTPRELWKFLFLWILFCFPAFGQQAPQSTYAPQLIIFPGAPSGTCDVYQFALNQSNGNYYTCTVATWTWTAVLGSGAPANPVNCLQKNLAGFFGSTAVCEAGSILNIEDDTHFKGPNPYVDPTRYGVRSLDSRFIPGVPGITGTINSGSASLTVSSSNCNLQVSSICFQNGDGLVIVGAGAAQAMVAPTPTVVPSVASGPTGTAQTVAGPTGATTYNYKIVAVDKGRGMTVPSRATTIVSGQASLGGQSVNITSCSRSGTTVTCLTAAHKIAVGTYVLITQASDGSFSGGYLVATVPDNTHFTYTSGFDTAAGASTSSTGGTAKWFNENLITWSHAAGAHQYIICSDRGGAGYAAIGISKPDNNARGITDMALSFDDLGSPAMDNFVLPYWAGKNPCTAASPQNDELVTTISSGAPGTSFTLAATASTPVTNQTVLFDNVPTFLTAVSNSTFGPLNIPVNKLVNSSYVFNSYMTMPSAYDICQLGSVTINDTIQLSSGQRWSGACPTVGSSLPSSTWEAYAGVGVGPAYPGFYMATGLMNVRNLQMSSGSGNQKVLALFDTSGVPSGTMCNMNFQTGGAGDYMGMGLVIRGLLNDSPSTILLCGNFLFTGGAGGGFGTTTTPLFYADPAGLLFDHISMTKRGIAFKPASQPAGGWESIGSIYMNGGITPLVTVTTGGGAGSNFHFGTVTIDTVGLPLFVNLDAGSIGQTITIDNLNSGPSFDGASFPPLTSGQSTQILGFGSVFLNSGYTRNITFIPGIGNSAATSPFGQRMMQMRAEADVAVGSTRSVFINGLAPTGFSGSAIAGGIVPVGTMPYQVVPVWQNGAEGNYSVVVSVVTTPGNQKVSLSWTAIPGNPLGYNVYRSGALTLCTTPTTTATSFVDDGSTLCGNSRSTQPTGGPSVMSAGFTAAPQFKGEGFIVTTPKFTTNNGCTDSATSGGATAGTFTVTSVSCTEIITMGGALTAPHGWSCTAIDLTTLADVTNPHQTATSTTTATIVTGTIVSGDKIQFSCIGY